MKGYQFGSLSSSASMLLGVSFTLLVWINLSQLVELVKQVSSRTHWLTQESHASLLWSASTLSLVALPAAAYAVLPRGLTSLTAWDHVVNCSSMATTVLASMVVSSKDSLRSLTNQQPNFFDCCDRWIHDCVEGFSSNFIQRIHFIGLKVDSPSSTTEDGLETVTARDLTHWNVVAIQCQNTAMSMLVMFVPAHNRPPFYKITCSISWISA